MSTFQKKNYSSEKENGNQKKLILEMELFGNMLKLLDQLT